MKDKKFMVMKKWWNDEMMMMKWKTTTLTPSILDISTRCFDFWCSSYKKSTVDLKFKSTVAATFKNEILWDDLNRQRAQRAHRACTGSFKFLYKVWSAVCSPGNIWCLKISREHTVPYVPLLWLGNYTHPGKCSWLFMWYWKI